MHWLRPACLAIAAALLGPTASAGSCPSDLDGDRTVTINEIITIVNAALDGCATAAPPAVPGCPGDLNDDDTVTVDEIIIAVLAALDGCPAEPTPTPSPERCPYTLLDDTFAVGMSCGYSGPFSNTAECPRDLSALVLGDGRLIVVSIGSDPIITFGGVVRSATTADIVSYFIGDDLTPQPLAGVMEVDMEGHLLTIAPETTPDFSVGGTECTFDRYLGTFSAIVGGG